MKQNPSYPSWIKKTNKRERPPRGGPRSETHDQRPTHPHTQESYKKIKLKTIHKDLVQTCVGPMHAVSISGSLYELFSVDSEGLVFLVSSIPSVFHTPASSSVGFPEQGGENLLEASLRAACSKLSLSLALSLSDIWPSVSVLVPLCCRMKPPLCWWNKALICEGS